MRRFAHWEFLLAEYLAYSKHRRFRWGSFDCALFVCGAINAMTGDDPGEAFRGTYQDAEGARKVIQEFADGGLLELARKVASQFGYGEIPPLMAQRGDVIYFATEQQPGTLGVVDLSGTMIVAVSKRKILRIPLEMGEYAWRIA